MSSEEEEFEFDGEEEDEAEEDDPIKSNKRRKSSVDSDSDDSDDSDDDDIPLSQLVSPPKKKKSPAQPKKKKSPAPPKKKTISKQESNTSEPIVHKTIAGAIFDSGCVKGMLIQRLLCRWWYAIDWPTGIPDKPPKNYDSMDGMPGIFVCTSGDDVGKIKDCRDIESRPSFSNFLEKPSSELRDLLITAIEQQTKALIEVEGSGTVTEKELKEMLKWAKKVNAAKSDSESKKVLKKAKITT